MKISVTRKQLTTLGIVQLFVVFMVFGIIQRRMQRVEIFTDDQEWQPHLNSGFGSRPNTSQSGLKFRPTWHVKHQSASRAVVTLFTVFEEVWDSNSVMYRNTLRNWAALKPLVVPVLFVNSADNGSAFWVKAAFSLGWEVRNITKTIRGLPVLKNMFIDVVKHYNTPFCGYAKANILFDGSLIRDMQLHLRYLKAYENHGGLLLIGRRTDIHMNEFGDRFDPQNLATLTETGKKNGTLADSYHEDYLLTTRHTLPWTHTPDLVIGQSGYGNWLVVKARLCNITVIDASYTLMALYRRARSDGYRHRNSEIPRCINKRLVRIARFDCSKGVTECAPYASHEDESGTVKLYQRVSTPYWCNIDYSEPCIEDLAQYDIHDYGSLFWAT